MNGFERILVPVDYSEPSSAALRLAAGLARACNARLLVLYLVPIDVYAIADFPIIAPSGIQMTDETQRLRAHVRKVLGDVDLPAFDVEAAWGSPHQEIPQYAIERKADLIVMGTHGRTGLKHVLLGSVAERTVRLAPCPVLTIRGDVGRPSAATEGGSPHRRAAGEVGRMMTHATVSVAPRDTLERARALMVEAGIRHLPVVDGARVVGMLTDREIGPHVGQLARTRVDAAMTPDPKTATADMRVEDAARLMLEHGIRALPVVDGERIVGILSSSDILEDYVRVARAQWGGGSVREAAATRAAR